MAHWEPLKIGGKICWIIDDSAANCSISFNFVQSLNTWYSMYYKVQGRAGSTIVPVVPWEGSRRQGPPDQLHFLHANWRLNVQCRLKRNNVTTTKKRSSTLGERKVQPREAPPEKIYEKYEKRAPALREWLIRLWFKVKRKSRGRRVP